MGENSKIEWTHHTFNLVVGCAKVSPACANCYAESLAKRRGWAEWGTKTARKVMSDGYWRQPLRWDRAAAKAGERRRVFCSSLADVFEDHPTVTEQRARLWPLIQATPNLDWMLLTKRPENIARMLPADWGEGCPNVWMGCTVENQKYAAERIPYLANIPAVVRFLSCEPLLGPVDLTRLEIVAPSPPYGPGVWLNALTGHVAGPDDMLDGRISLVITGGESGTKARPSHPDWFRDLRDQCQRASVPFHFKQWGEWVEIDREQWRDGPRDGVIWPSGISGSGILCDADEAYARGCRPVRRVGKKAAGRLLDGRTWDEMPEVAR